MGLKSLPILNKSGVSMYWMNVWDSIKLYKKYSLGFLYLNDVIQFFLNENIYYYCIKKIKITGKDYMLEKYLNLTKSKRIKRVNNKKHFYFGKILFLKNQGWTIILVNYYIGKRILMFEKYKDILNTKKIIKIFKTNKTSDFSSLYRNKFKF